VIPLISLAPGDLVSPGRIVAAGTVASPYGRYAYGKFLPSSIYAYPLVKGVRFLDIRNIEYPGRLQLTPPTEEVETVGFSLGTPLPLEDMRLHHCSLVAQLPAWDVLHAASKQRPLSWDDVVVAFGALGHGFDPARMSAVTTNAPATWLQAVIDAETYATRVDALVAASEALAATATLGWSAGFLVLLDAVHWRPVFGYVVASTSFNIKLLNRPVGAV